MPLRSAPTPPTSLAIRELTKAFDRDPVIQSLDLEVRRGELLSLVGPSGCGKTTLLRLVAGLLREDAGRIVLNGQDVTDRPPHRRNVGMMFQSYALFPHLSVAGNIAFGLRARGRSKGEIAHEVDAVLEVVRLRDVADRRIGALSGGQQQRTALARALVVKPALLLFDEPFNALDRQLRETMQIELRALLGKLEITSLFVTHDQDEALILSDRIAVMNNGRIEQCADPATVYAAPATPFVLDLMGRSMKVHGQVAEQLGSRVRVDTAIGPVLAEAPLGTGRRVLLAVRPERVELAAPLAGRDNGAALTVSRVSYLGARSCIDFEADAGDRFAAELVNAPPACLRPGQVVTLRWAIADTLAYALD